MGAQYKPVKGDRVRVVYEGEAQDPDDLGFSISEEGLGSVPFFFADAGLVSVEKIEPPVEVFKPGDVVRGKVFGHVFTIADDGYVSHSTGAFRPGYNEFNSVGYEKVSLG